MRPLTRTALGCAFSLALTLAPVTPASASSTGRCGGTSGSHSKTLSCPSGHYIVGLRARGGVYVDQVGILCARFLQDGSRADLGSWKTGGGSGGTHADSAICSGNTAIATISTRSGSYLDKVESGGCVQRRRNSRDFTTHVFSRAPVHIGGPGGIACSLSCPDGEALHSVTVRYGNWIDSISGHCRK